MSAPGSPEPNTNSVYDIELSPDLPSPEGPLRSAPTGCGYSRCAVCDRARRLRELLRERAEEARLESGHMPSYNPDASVTDSLAGRPPWSDQPSSPEISPGASNYSSWEEAEEGAQAEVVIVEEQEEEDEEDEDEVGGSPISSSSDDGSGYVGLNVGQHNNEGELEPNAEEDYPSDPMDTDDTGESANEQSGQAQAVNVIDPTLSGNDMVIQHMRLPSFGRSAAGVPQETQGEDGRRNAATNSAALGRITNVPDIVLSTPRSRQDGSATTNTDVMETDDEPVRWYLRGGAPLRRSKRIAHRQGAQTPSSRSATPEAPAPATVLNLPDRCLWDSTVPPTGVRVFNHPDFDVSETAARSEVLEVLGRPMPRPVEVRTSGIWSGPTERTIAEMRALEAQLVHPTHTLSWLRRAPDSTDGSDADGPGSDGPTSDGPGSGGPGSVTLDLVTLDLVTLDLVTLDQTIRDLVTLKQITLDQSNLDQSNLDQSNLDRTSLDLVNLDWTNLDWTNLDWTNLDQINRKQINLKHINLKQAHLDQITLARTALDRTVLDRTALDQIDLHHKVLHQISRSQILRARTILAPPHDQSFFSDPNRSPDSSTTRKRKRDAAPIVISSDFETNANDITEVTIKAEGTSITNSSPTTIEISLESEEVVEVSSRLVGTAQRVKVEEGASSPQSGSSRASKRVKVEAASSESREESVSYAVGSSMPVLGDTSFTQVAESTFNTTVMFDSDPDSPLPAPPTSPSSSIDSFPAPPSYFADQLQASGSSTANASEADISGSPSISESSSARSRPPGVACDERDAWYDVKCWSRDAGEMLPCAGYKCPITEAVAHGPKASRRPLVCAGCATRTKWRLDAVEDVQLLARNSAGVCATCRDAALADYPPGLDLCSCKTELQGPWYCQACREHCFFHIEERAARKRAELFRTRVVRGLVVRDSEKVRSTMACGCGGRALAAQWRVRRCLGCDGIAVRS
ncbi:MAG: hypothetical protein M1817_005417 [Caeruleum heppii]|nr:MAG: hypothetical protein M1817_005417 [Caeruleum heppii]